MCVPQGNAQCPTGISLSASSSQGLLNANFTTFDQPSGNNQNVSLTFRLPWVETRAYTAVSFVTTAGTLATPAGLSCITPPIVVNAVPVISRFSYFPDANNRGETGPNVGGGCYDVWNIQVYGK